MGYNHITNFFHLPKGLPVADHNSFHGPLKVHPKNPRYFTDDTKRAIYLTGSHTWANFQESGLDNDPPFDFTAYLDLLEGHNHNFIRLWVWEHGMRAPWTNDPVCFTPLPYLLSGSKYDLNAWNPTYFERLRQRVELAAARGIYVSIMLFQGWSLNKTGNPEGDPWLAHPFNGVNNINGVDVPIGGLVDDDINPTLHSLGNPEVLARQEAYIRKVIDTVNYFDNVLYEIINEGGSTAWQYHMIEYIHTYERGKPKQHPVGMTHRIAPEQFNSDLFNSPADWISPGQEPQNCLHPGSIYLQDYRNDPIPADGRKVILSDTDHLWGHGGNHKWVWKSFLRGMNPIFMDPWKNLAGRLVRERTQWMHLAGGISKDQPDYPDWEPIRLSMGTTRRYAEKINLVAMTPHGEMASTRYCLANLGKEYLVYLPDGGLVTLDLRNAKGNLSVEWFFPILGRVMAGPEPVPGGKYATLAAPYSGDAVLYLSSQSV